MQKIDFSKIKKVLVAKLRHHGDVLLSSPVFALLKKRYPHIQLDAYIYSETLPMLEGHPAISQYILYEKKWKSLPFIQRYWKEIKILNYIRSQHYDLVINLTEGDRGAVAAKVSRAPFAIGFDAQGGGMRGKNGCYTHIIKHSPRPRHTVEKQLDALRCLGIFPNEDERELLFHIPSKARDTVEVLVPQEYIQIHPVSRWMFKTLPTDTLATVIQSLVARGENVVLTASSDPQEMALNARIKELVPQVINLAGKLTLKELGAVIDKSRLLITVDSVPLHMASALKKPTVAIFGPTCEQNWGPWRNSNTSIVSQPLGCRPCYQPGCGGSGVSDCLQTLSSQRILDAVWQRLDRLS